MTGVTVKYNDQVIKNQAIDGNFNLKTANKYLTDDITITTDKYVNSLDVNYGDTALIDSVNGNHTYKLRCKDTIMSDDLNFSCQVTEYVSYITFSSPESFTLATANSTKNWNGTLEYSTDKLTWSTWDGTTTLSSGDGNNLYLRGIDNTRITGRSYDYVRWILTGSNISCTGNIENLLDYQTVTRGEHPVMAICCYSYMFYGCTSLTTAPELPATTLIDQCYAYMFQDCISLISPPELPATMSANDCYKGMFYGCTSLTSVPALPATTLAERCYHSMFARCTSLTTLPALPATSLATHCYYAMFNGCTSLTSVPALPATTLAERCYCSMFSTSNLIKLSTTQTGEYQIPYRIPSSGTGAAGTDSLLSMFNFTGGTFKGTPEINTTYYLSTSNSIVYPNYLTFSSSHTFTLAVNNSTKNWDGELEYSLDANSWNTWDGTTTLTSSAVDSSAPISRLYLRGTGNTYITGYTSSSQPGRRWILTETNSGGIYCTGNIENLLDYQTVAQGQHPVMARYCYYELFYRCGDLVSAPELPSPNLSDWCYASMFHSSAIVSAPRLPATSLALRCYSSMFNNCKVLTSAPELPATTLAVNCYQQMFNMCDSLTTAPALPATTLADHCYYRMFYTCSSLVAIPALPALAVSENQCYREMFGNCASVKLSETQVDEYQISYRIPISGTGVAGNDAMYYMFYGTGGTFASEPDINTTYWLSTSNSVVYPVGYTA